MVVPETKLNRDPDLREVNVSRGIRHRKTAMALCVPVFLGERS